MSESTSPFNIEKPACFYLGREFDLASSRPRPEGYVMYDARDLTTHGVVVGMTGSGKTGLCVSLLEEAAIDGIPCVVIDPKGDLSNLLLQFPRMEAEDFLPWVSPDDARRKSMTREAFAADLAQRWRQGLADSAQPPDRVARCRESSEWRIYTPGSEAGLPVSILASFKAPQGELSREAMNQRVDATASAILGLTGSSADPIQSREHILVAQLLLHSWNRGKDLDLRALIQQVQVPPFDQVGAFDVETFYPEKERLRLAIALNNILAAPSFATWIHGEPLDLARMMYADNKPRQLVFSIAHLDDVQRMFFVTLLLEEILNWTRRQEGTSELRALVYMDEVFGYLPPHPANPPSKMPLMTLLKQARAFGVGILLATQNPVDLDYKALSNAGTWFVGKLQTERDKARLVEGLEGVAAERGTLSDRNHLESVISSLRNRVFLLHNVHQGRPLVFQSRWALSFLRGPMTRDQIATLMAPFKETPRQQTPKQQASKTAPIVAIPVCSACQAELLPGSTLCPGCGKPRALPQAIPLEAEFKERLQQKAAAPAPRAAVLAPELPDDLKVTTLPVRLPGASAIVYRPRILGCAEVAFVDRRKGLDLRRMQRLLAEAPQVGEGLNWTLAESLDGSLEAPSVPGATWDSLPETINSARKLRALEKSFAEHLYANARLRLFENKKLGLVSTPGEDEAAFLARCRDAALVEARKAYDTERMKYLPRFQALGIPLPAYQPESATANPTGGLMSWLLSPFRKETLTIPTATTKKQIDLEAEWKGKVAGLYEKWRQVGEDHSELLLTPRKVDVRITHFALAWTPYQQIKTPEGARIQPVYR